MKDTTALAIKLTERFKDTDVLSVEVGPLRDLAKAHLRVEAQLAIAMEALKAINKKTECDHSLSWSFKALQEIQALEQIKAVG